MIDVGQMGGKAKALIAAKNDASGRGEISSPIIFIDGSRKPSASCETGDSIYQSRPLPSPDYTAWMQFLDNQTDHAFGAYAVRRIPNGVAVKLAVNPLSASFSMTTTHWFCW